MIDLLRFLHVFSISLWLGAALWVSGDVRRAMQLGRPHVDTLAARVWPALRVDLSAGLAAVLTGILLLVAEGVMPPRWGIVAGLVFALARLGVLTVLRRAFRSLAERLRGGEEIPPHAPAVRRIAMLSGIAHTLWLAALAGMVFPV